MTCIQRRYFTWYWRQILTLLQRQKLTSHSRQFITCKKLSFPTLLQPYADVMLWRQYNLGATSCARWVYRSMYVLIFFLNIIIPTPHHYAYFVEVGWLEKKVLHFDRIHEILDKNKENDGKVGIVKNELPFCGVYRCLKYTYDVIPL